MLPDLVYKFQMICSRMTSVQALSGNQSTDREKIIPMHSGGRMQILPHKFEQQQSIASRLHSEALLRLP